MTLGEHPALPDPPPADLLRYGDETRHDPTAGEAADRRRRAYERLRRERLLSYLPETGRRGGA
jgi:hypothetical protein